jgi:hypothetical protein
MDHFVAGKETAIFVSFNAPVTEVFRTPANVHLSVFRDNALVTHLLPVEQAGSHSFYFQPRSMADVGNWPPGVYRFDVVVNDELWATRTTSFHQSGRLRILAVPIKANYGGRIMSCTGEWRGGGVMIAPTFPVARADVEFILGNELDLSARRFDLHTDDGMYNVWAAVAALQTRNNDYDIILGIVPTHMDGILGYTYGTPAVIASEDDPEYISTVIHEIAHVYNIGDEYNGGSMNIRVNMPPYGYSGRAIAGRGRETGNNRNVRPGLVYDGHAVGSYIYPQQRPFHVEARQPLHAVSSYMSSGGFYNPWYTWVTSDIWIHLFHTFTGVSRTGSAPLEGIPVIENITTSRGSYINSGDCFLCGSRFRDADFYAHCKDCNGLTYIDDPETESRFRCWRCRARWDITEDNLYIECAECIDDMLYVEFMGFNASGSNDSPGQTIVSSGECFICDGSFTNADFYGLCSDCNGLTHIRNPESDTDFNCWRCSKHWQITENNFYIECARCVDDMLYTEFLQFNAINFNVSPGRTIINSGECFICDRNFADADFYGLCNDCNGLTHIRSPESDTDFNCWRCSKHWHINESNLYIECARCVDDMLYTEFLIFNNNAAAHHHEQHSGEYWGECPECFLSVYGLPEFLVECDYCFDIWYWDYEDWYHCGWCGYEDEVTAWELYIICTECDEPVWLEWFMFYNEAPNARAERQVHRHSVTIVEITGFVTADGEFTADPWYTYDVDVTLVHNRIDGEYTIRFFDVNDVILSTTTFDTEFEAQFRTRAGSEMRPTAARARQRPGTFPGWNAQNHHFAKRLVYLRNTCF